MVLNLTAAAERLMGPRAPQALPARLDLLRQMRGLPRKFQGAGAEEVGRDACGGQAGPSGVKREREAGGEGWERADRPEPGAAAPPLKKPKAAPAPAGAAASPATAPVRTAKS